MVQKAEETSTFDDEVDRVYRMLLHSMAQIPDGAGTLPPSLMGGIMILAEKEIISAAIDAPKATKEDPVALWGHGVTMGIQAVLLQCDSQTIKQICQQVHDKMEVME